MEAYYSIIQKENEYRILLTSVNTGGLPVHIQQVLSNRKIDISELIIERVSGESTTGQEVLKCTAESEVPPKSWTLN